ncbi:MAG TPA: hypothetical protein VF832_14100, partial [Longimicrobiales bacterium]
HAGQHAHDAHVHGCTCLGACVLSAAALPPRGASAPAVPVASALTAPVVLAVLVRGAGGHFLPFAHAPPLLS